MLTYYLAYPSWQHWQNERQNIHFNLAVLLKAIQMLFYHQVNLERQQSET